MKYKIHEMPYGFCLISYRTFFGIPFWFRFTTHQSMNDCLDKISADKKPKTIDELMAKKNRLEAELDEVKRFLREEIYKQSQKIK